MEFAEIMLCTKHFDIAFMDEAGRHAYTQLFRPGGGDFRPLQLRTRSLENSHTRRSDRLWRHARRTAIPSLPREPGFIDHSGSCDGPHKFRPANG